MDGWMDVAVCSLCLTLSAKINILAQLGSSELLRYPPTPVPLCPAVVACCLHIDVIYHLCLWGVQQFTVQIVWNSLLN